MRQSLAGATKVDQPTGLRRLTLAHLPTPLEEAPRLAAALGLGGLWIKREDLSGYALGGNKLRKLDFLLAEAMDAGADTLIATAGYQSNFCRALAGAAAKVSMGCHLHLRAAGALKLEGNLLLDRIFGASITISDAIDPWDPVIRAELEAIAHDVRAKGYRPWVVQLTGESAPLGTAAWFSGAHELVDDFSRIGAEPHVVVVACGSGLTLAGLALGLKHLGSRTRVLGFSVQQPASRLLPWVIDVAERTARRLEIATRLTAEDLTIVGDQIGSGYGVATPAALDAVALAGQSEALVLDPIYTGKAFAGLAANARSGALGPSASAVFLHSGGTPGLFANAPAFAELFS
jgi:1-aminocyclopropane-1-carboxylate deaminase/D-cysteine desulfhydrase-like pyridoxal-dependent ACC family enzyme